MSTSPQAKRFKQTQLPRQQGELARFKVVQGPDYGAVFVITGPSVNIGRGEENDIVLTDLKTSRMHANVMHTSQGWTLRDLGSANGILHNQRPTKSIRIQTGDTLRLGETTLEFVTADVGTQMIMASPKSPEQLRNEQSALDAQRQRVQALGSIRPPGSPVSGRTAAVAPFQASASRGKAQGGLQRVLLMGGALGLIYFIVGDPSPSPKKTVPVAKLIEPRQLASLLPPEVSAENKKTIDSLFRAGFREYREGNFLRARAQFDTVLQIDPTHALARLYSANCDGEIDREVRFHKEQGRRSLSLGRRREARGHFDAVLRLRARDQSHGEYQEAIDQLKKIDALEQKQEGAS